MTNNSLIPTDQEMKSLETICKYAVESKYFQSLGGLPGVMCIAMYAKEIGVSPMKAIMGGFSNVQGKITMSAELMHSLLREAGVRLKIIRSDETVCEIHGKRADTGDEYTSVYTIENAKKANLVKSGGAWEKNTSDMLFARCISRLRRRLAPDIATKAYVEGEIEEAEHEIIDEKPSMPQALEPTDAEIASQFKEKFKPVENMDFDLDDYLLFYTKTYNRTLIDTMKGALKQPDKFSKVYQQWVDKQKPIEEVSAVIESPKEMSLV